MIHSYPKENALYYAQSQNDVNHSIKRGVLIEDKPHTGLHYHI